MNDSQSDFVLDGIEYGTHQTKWDLRVLCFAGAARIPRKNVLRLIEEGAFPSPEANRIAFVRSIYDAFETKISLGISRSTVISQLEAIWTFFKWCDSRDLELSHDHATTAFKKYAEFQKNRALVDASISIRHARSVIKHLSSLLSKTLQLPGEKSGTYLLELANLPKTLPGSRPRSLPQEPEELRDFFSFGAFLKKICDDLDASAVEGPLPIRIPVNRAAILTLAGNLMRPDIDPDDDGFKGEKQAAKKRRAPLPEGTKAIDSHKRSSILNLRIESELLMFIAQTGMNLKQAASMKRDQYRWQSVGDDLMAFRVYKGRRSGEAIFRCFRSYRKHLRRYLNWLDEVGIYESNDQRLFPLIARGMIPAAGASPNFYATRKAAKSLEMKFFSPQKIRVKRINWLLNHTKDISLTANLSAHSEGVLVADYAKPDLKEVAKEIALFNDSLDGASPSAGPGICSAPREGPEILEEADESVPKPDCTNPDGCLFCVNHRDLMSYDYCWKLASHCRLKELELGANPAIAEFANHPAKRVVDRINLKLEALAEIGKESASWVRKAKDQIRSSIHHPDWALHISILEGRL